MTVVMVYSMHGLEERLDSLGLSKKTDCRYLVLGKDSDQEQKLLNKKGFKEAEKPERDSAYRERFLREYVDLVGSLGKEVASRAWWATDIASKNRFTSKLSLLLEEFLLAVVVIQEATCDYLVILNPAWPIIPSLKQELKNRGIKFICMEDWNSKFKDILSSVTRQACLTLFYFLKTSWRRWHARKKLQGAIKNHLQKDKLYYVIKTFIYNHSFSEDGSYRDVFFGSLPHFLRGKKDVVIFANILPNYRESVKKIKLCDSQCIIPLEMFLSLPDLLKAFMRVLCCRIKFKRAHFFFGYNVTGIINCELFRTFKGIQFYQYLHYEFTKGLLKNIRVENFLYTYENNPWEKMCIMAIRRYSPGTRIIGYQHAVIPQASANMFVSHPETEFMPMPDRILTTGEVPKEIMERYGSFPKGIIKPACGLRYEYLASIATGSRRERSGNILLVLEGIPEGYKLVNYVLQQLKDDKNCQVTMRPHPVLPFAAFQGKLNYTLQDISNFRLSKNISLKEDIKAADIIIYWGSTVALEALSIGKPVIHFDTETFLSYDALFECQSLKWRVAQGDDLKRVVNEIYAMSDNDFAISYAKAKEYIEGYFWPVREKYLDRFVA